MTLLKYSIELMYTTYEYLDQFFDRMSINYLMKVDIRMYHT